jgi:predicted AlkP superfamily phosphohydrolase/phosphomutase
MSQRTPPENARPPQPRSDRPTDPGRREALKKLAALGFLALVDAGALSSCGRRALSSISRERKVIVLGLDGLDADYVARLMDQGKLPNMSRLRTQGAFRALTSSIPPQSPVAWATFITGRDPGGHGIYDFIQRDPKTYLPYLSIARTEPPERSLSLGQWKVPLSRGKLELLRRGRAFWEFLDNQGIPASAYRVPSNFPPQDTGAKQLAGLGAPDLHGTYGEFSYYTDSPAEAAREVTGGAIFPVRVSDGRVKAELVGPPNTLLEGQPECRVEFEAWVDRDHKLAKILVQGRETLLREGEWSDWVPVRFEIIPRLKHVSGICRFYLKQAYPNLKLYVTPINVDPLDPAIPITAPAGFAHELGAQLGRFYTQGFPHDVKALRHGILNDGEYLQQSGIAMGEARRMYEWALHRFSRGLLFYYFSTSDRTQHMFWRTMDSDHPAYDPGLARKYGPVIEDCYRASDELVGQALEAADRDTTVIVLSDHGFAPYHRSFNLNSWLAEAGYLAGVGPWEPGADIFSHADWYGTLAYGLGFNALYLNLRGREPHGVVSPDERAALARQLAQELVRVRDPQTGERVIEDVHVAEDVYSKDQAERAPDLVVGYARGYRCSDESVLGEVTDDIVQDNTDKWSGDHCIDRSLVPGVLLTNKPFSAESPALPDVTAGVLAEFGIPTPDEMNGKPIW